jgi:hypothetical protein
MTPRSSTGRGGTKHFYYECAKGAHSSGIECEDWHTVKEIVALHVEAIDWHQDTDDPTAGTVKIMLFAEAHAGYGVEKCAKKHSNALPVNGGALERNGKLLF